MPQNFPLFAAPYQKPWLSWLVNFTICWRCRWLHHSIQYKIQADGHLKYNLQSPWLYTTAKSIHTLPPNYHYSGFSRSVKHPDLIKKSAHNNRFNSTLDHVCAFDLPIIHFDRTRLHHRYYLLPWHYILKA